MIQRNIPQPIQFYDTIAQRDVETCKGQTVDSPIFHPDWTQYFVIERDSDPNADWNLQLYHFEGRVTYGLPGAVVEAITIGGKDYIYHRPFPIPHSLKQGTYCLILADGSHYYASNYFRLSDCTDKMTYISWRDTCARTGMPWANIPEPFEFRVWVDTRLGPSVVSTDETVEDDGEKETVTAIRTTTRRALADVFPDHMLRCFHAMKHHSIVTIVAPQGPTYELVKVGDISASPVARGCKQSISVQFIVDEEWRSACCDEFNTGSSELCLMDDAVEVSVAIRNDGIGGFEASGSTGEKAIVTGPGYAQVRQIGEAPTYAVDGTIYIAEQDLTYFGEDVAYYVEGGITTPVAYLLNPEISITPGVPNTAVIGSQSFVTGRFAAIQYSMDGVSWEQVWAGTESELADGISFLGEVYDGSIWRVRYYNHGCEYGYSPWLYSSEGELDEDFSEGGLNNQVATFKVQADGKIVVGGSFSSYGATAATRYTRLTASGALDTAYNTALGTGFNDTVYVVGLLPTGESLIGGEFTQLNGATANYFACLDVDGAVSGVFDTGSGCNDAIGDIAVLPDGRVVIVGRFTTYRGAACRRIAMIGPDGTLDGSFATGISNGFDGDARRVAIDTDGTILVANGFFDNYAGTPVRHPSGSTIVRINVSGALDSVVAQGTQFNGLIENITPYPGGRLIVTGEFTGYNGTSVGRIARLNSDGSLDTAFTTANGTGFSGPTFRTHVQPDGKIIVGTNVGTTFNGTGVNGMARLNADGTLDTTFNTGSGYGAGPTISIRPGLNGSLIVVGGFTSFDGTTRLRVARFI